jgi:hypothetical protein
MLARVRRDHGEVDISCLVNDRRAGTGPAPSGPAPTLGQLRAAAAPTTTRWGRKLDVLDYKLIVSVDAAPDAVDLSILADTHCIGPAGIEALALGMEAVAVAAADAAPAATGIHPGRAGSAPVPLISGRRAGPV